MVKIRLTQTGKRDARMYRIIAIEDSKRRDGKAIEILGYYNPTVKPKIVKIDLDRVKYWIGVGAQITEGAQKVLELNKKS